MEAARQLVPARADAAIADRPGPAVDTTAASPRRLWLASESDRWALWTPVAIGFGAWSYFASPVEPDPMWRWAAAAVAATLLVARFWRGPRAPGPAMRVASAAIALIVLGYWAAADRSVRASAPIWPTDARDMVALEGRVIAATPKPGGERWRLTLDRLRIDGIAAERTPARARLTVPAPTGARPIDLLGARASATAKLYPPRGPAEPGAREFRLEAWMQRVGAVGWTRAPPRILAAAEVETAPLGWEQRAWLWLEQLRARIAERARAASPGVEGAVVAALLVGDRSGIDAAAVQALRDSNLAHLLAISGLHMGIVCLTTFALARLAFAASPSSAGRFDPKKLAAVAALAAGVAYLALSGAAVSTQRAFLMAAVAFGAVLVDRPAITLRAVAAAATVILLWRPESLFAPGFQLSFAATTAMVAVFETVREHPAIWSARRAALAGESAGGWARLLLGRGRFGAAARWGGALALGSLVAGLATAPFAAAAFNRLARYGLIANLAATPTMGIWIMPCGVAALVLAPFGLDPLAYRAMAFGVSYVLAVAETVSAWPNAVRLTASAPDWTLAALTVGGLWLCLWRGAALRLLAVAPAALGVVGWLSAARPDVLTAPGGGAIGVLSIAADGARTLDRVGPHRFSASVWLRRDGDAASPQEAVARPGVARFRGGATVRARRDWRVELALSRRLSRARAERLCRDGAILIAPLASMPRALRDGAAPTLSIAPERRPPTRRPGAIGATAAAFGYRRRV